MKKNKVDYCSKCKRLTEHHVVECEDSAFFRAFETIITIGFATLFERNYYCRCTKCNEIKKIKF